MSFSINPDINLKQIAEDFANKGRVRVRDFLSGEQAHALADCLARETAYQHAFVLDGNFGSASDEQLRSLSDSDRQALFQRVLDQASQGVGFWYGRCAVTSDGSPLDAFQRWLSEKATLAFFADITSAGSFHGASVQATRFNPGDFLTRHSDELTAEGRRVAFVINLSKDWHPDWGGLLQFFESDGLPTDAWNPDFNSLALFDVSQVHSVTCVAPFAPLPRLAVSGWLHRR